MSDRVLLLLCAAHSLGFAAFHLGFWKRFAWHEQLPRMSVASLAIHALSALCALGVVVFASPVLR